jgi:hypothetical protein
LQISAASPVVKTVFIAYPSQPQETPLRTAGFSLLGYFTHLTIGGRALQLE